MPLHRSFLLSSRLFMRSPSTWNRFSCHRNKTNICIVGSGPAGFYTADYLLKKTDAQIDVIEKQPVPFGLMRYGVAPDHPEIKNVIHKFTDIADHERCQFYGNIKVGKDVSIKELLGMYNAVVLAYGADEDHKLDIPGEDMQNVFSARELVSWFNGVPGNDKLPIDLNREVAVIIGCGNVALDIARILILSPDELKKTDITDYALEALKESKIRKVILVGRRGPMHIACTIKELRELTKLEACQMTFNPKDFEGVKEILPNLKRPRLRLTELLLTTAEENLKKSNPDAKTLEFQFYRYPRGIIENGLNKPQNIILGINEPTGPLDVGAVTDTRKNILVDCGMVVRSIRYRSIPLDPTIPFNDVKNIIPNKQGRVDCDEPLYCSGWVKTGPVGVIPSTMKDSFETGAKLVQDLSKGQIPTTERNGSKDMLSLLKERGIAVTTFDHWAMIDAEEIKRGSLVGKPREKVTSVSEMLRIAGLA